MDLSALGTRAVDIAVILVIAVIVRWLLHRVINRVVSSAEKRFQERTINLDARASAVLNAAGGLRGDRRQQRTQTLGSVLKSVVNWVVAIVALLTILDSLGISLGPVIASAGIGGLAIGFGAQSLIKDLISGAFLVFEDQFGVGDYIKVGTLEGTVQHIGFRTTRLQDPNGQVWYVRNGEIVTLGNRTQGWSTSYIAIPVGVTEDPLRVIGLLQQVVGELEEDPVWQNRLLEPATVLGLSSIDNTQMTFTVMTKAPAGEHFAVEREIRARAVRLFQQENIRASVALMQPSGWLAAPPDVADPHSELPKASDTLGE